MTVKKLSDMEVEQLIDLWRNEPVLWDVTLPRYSNIDDRKAALGRISREIGDVDIGKSYYLSVIVH